MTVAAPAPWVEGADGNVLVRGSGAAGWSLAWRMASSGKGGFAYHALAAVKSPKMVQVGRHGEPNRRAHEAAGGGGWRDIRMEFVVAASAPALLVDMTHMLGHLELSPAQDEAGGAS